MPIPTFIKSKQPDLQLKITKQDKNKFPRKLLLVKIKVHEKPMPGTSHPPFPSASSLPALSQPSTSQGFTPSVSVATGNSNLVTQECFDLPIQSHYSAGQIHWPRALHNTLLVITCKYLPSLLHDIHNPNKSREDERTDVGKGMGAFKTHTSAWHQVQQHTWKRRKSGDRNI